MLAGKVYFVCVHIPYSLSKHKNTGIFLGGFMSYNLDKNQLEIAMHTTGAALTLAGPGSGKTTVLTERTMRLSQAIDDPSKILSVTFTNAAGEEMADRYLKKFTTFEEKKVKMPVFKTVHSFCNEIIREYETVNNIKYKRIESENKLKDNIIIELYKEINGNFPESNVLEKIRAINCNSKKIPEIKNVKKILQRYEKYKKEKNLIDFDDMIFLAGEILTSDLPNKKAIRELFCHRFEYVQLDEAQDLTALQFEIMEIIASNGNIFVVADDDQSIYGFRGAAPECLFEFQKRHQDCKVYYLARNYRSVKRIVDCSCKFIDQNKERFDKQLYSQKEKGFDPVVKSFKNGIKQAEYVFKEAQKLLGSEPELKIGVLYRNNISSLLPRTVFACMGTSCKCNGDYYKTHEMDFLDSIIFKMRKIERKNVFVPTPKKILRRMKEDGLYEQLESYCRESGRNIYFKDVITEFIEYLCNKTESVTQMVRLLEKIDNNTFALKNNQSMAVEFSTVHSSKGLEYDAVFIIDIIKGEFPGRGSSTGKDLEEERRLFYVAMTRAKRYLYLLYPEKCEGESMFVNEFKSLIKKL